MRATTIMLLAFGTLILTHWANKEPTVSVKLIVEMTFATLFVAFLDQGNAEPVATGLAWLFLGAVLLSKGSILTKLGTIGTAKPASVTTNNAATGPNNAGSAPTMTGA